LAASRLLPGYAPYVLGQPTLAGTETLITVLMAMLGLNIEIGAACAQLKN